MKTRTMLIMMIGGWAALWFLTLALVPDRFAEAAVLVLWVVWTAKMLIILRHLKRSGKI